MSLNMKRHIHESNLIEGYDDKRADQDSLDAWRWLNQYPRLDNHIIEKLQKKITTFQDDLRPDWRGYYRDLSNQQVYIGGHPAMNAAFVRQAMDNWLICWPLRSPKENHIAFEKIHPFVDGNGRTGRMLMWWQEAHSGQKPTLIKYEKRLEYYAWFS